MRIKNKYCEKYDSYFDKNNKWLERKCHDKECMFCSKRPDKHKKHKWEFLDGIRYCE